MPLLYKIVGRQKPGTGDPTSVKYYLSRNSTGLITTDIIAKEIAESAGQSEGTILGLLQDLHNEIITYLKNGYSIRMGNIGILRPSIHSEGKEKAEDLSAANIKRIGVCFLPSVNLKSSISLANPNLSFKEIGSDDEPEEILP